MNANIRIQAQLDRLKRARFGLSGAVDIGSTKWVGLSWTNLHDHVWELSPYNC